MMKRFFDYCFYRISKFYLSWGESNLYCSSGLIAVVSAMGFNCLSLITVMLYVFDEKWNFTYLKILIGISIVFMIIGHLYFNKKKYKQLQTRYKNEKNSKLKGWIVALYAIGSFIIYFVVMNVFDV